MNIRLLSSFVMLLFASVCLQAQVSDITGKVVDAAGEPMIGVNIAISGTTTGTFTDLDGMFSLKAKKGDVLKITYLGYQEKEIVVTSEKTYQITMADDINLLNEIVVVGYQAITRREVTTAISSLGAKDINPTTTSNVAEALQGKIPGLQVFQGGGQPGAQPKMLVRGFATISGNSDPLIIVDGVVTSFGGFNDLNPADIASVDVLKDAASTGIYGSRGGAGVILVTTKRGSGKTKFNFSGTTGVNHWVKPNLASSAEFIDHYTKLYAANNQPLPATIGSSATNTDWWDLAIRDGKTHNYNLSMSGGRNGVSFYASAGIFNQESNYNAQRGTGDYTRITTRFNIEYEANDKVKIGVNIAPRIEVYGNGGGIGLNSVLWSAPNYDPYKSVERTDADVQAFAKVTPKWDFNAYNPTFSQFNFGDFNQVGNPMAIMYRNFNKTNFLGTQASTFVQISPIKNLVLKSTLAGYFNSATGTNYDPKFFVAAQSQNILSGVSQNMNRDYRWQIENTATYKVTLGKNNLNLLVGQSADNATSSNNYVFRQDIPYDGDAYRNVAAAATLVTGTGFVQPGAAPWGKMSSFFARAQYDFNNTYYLAGSIRTDGSSLLAPANRWGVFPTISAGYIISNESFMKNLNWLDYMKVRASFGRVGGNLPNSVAAYQSTLSPVDYVDGNQQRIFGYSPSNVPDPNIPWETTQDITIGFDLDLIGNKLSMSFDRYWRSPKDMLLNLPIRPSIGYPQGYIPTIFTNVGTMTTSGFEGAINYKNSVGKLNYNIGLTYQKFTSRADDLKGQTIYDQISNDPFSSTRRTKTSTGDIVGGFYGYRVLGVFQTAEEVASHKGSSGLVLQPKAQPGDLKFENADGNEKFDLNDRVFLGSPYPAFAGGFTVQLNYGGFDFRTEFYGTYGNKVSNDALFRLNGIYRYNFISGEPAKYWNGPGSTNEFPKLGLTDQNGNFSSNSSFYIKDASFIRNKLMQIGYTFPKSWIPGVSDFRIFVSAQNLFTITNYEGLNPEIPFGAVSATSPEPLQYGIDRGQSPIPKIFNIGVNTNF